MSQPGSPPPAGPPGGYPPPGSSAPTQRLTGFDPGYPAPQGWHPDPAGQPRPAPSGPMAPGPAAPGPGGPGPGAPGPVAAGYSMPPGAGGPGQWGAPAAYQGSPATAPLPRPGTPAQQPPARPRRSTGLLVGVAAIGLTAGLLGGGAAGVLAGRTVTPQPLSPTPGAPVAVNRPDGSIAKIAAQALPSVVTIKIRGSAGSGTGSGFVVDDSGHIVTNNHVISTAASGGTIRVELHDGTSVDATIVGRDASYDLAVLKVDRSGLVPLQWGRSADIVVGDGVIAVGAPLGLESTVTTGIVSALGRPVSAGGGDETSYINAIQTDAAINPGNSGGPLLDLNGRVIGVNSAIARLPGSTSGTGGSIGLGFAIPSDQAAKTVQQLISTGKAVHPIVGVRLDSNYDGDGGKILSSGGVPSGGNAAAAGLRDGDVIVAIDGKRITSAEHLIVSIRSRDVGDTVRLTVDRGGQTVDITLTLQAG